MTIELTILISLIGLLIATLTFVTNFYRNNKKDTAEMVEERASMAARVLTKLDDISDDIREIKKDNQSIRKDISSLSDRVLILEQRQVNIDPAIFTNTHTNIPKEVFNAMLKQQRREKGIDKDDD